MVSFFSLCSFLLAFSFVFVSRYENFVDARTQDHYNSTASLSTLWTNNATLGYLAPEWISAAITEKVDMYSFGVVILEIVCGRKIFDRSLDGEDMHLLSLFKRKAEGERLLDIVDDCSDDMQLNGLQAVNMLRIAAWCLQGDYTKRPSMSIVIKVLEGVSEVHDDLDYNFYAPPSTNGAAKFSQMEVEFSATTALVPSILSGPR